MNECRRRRNLKAVVSCHGAGLHFTSQMSVNNGKQEEQYKYQEQQQQHPSHKPSHSTPPQSSFKHTTMGRLTTALAASATRADNLPGELPNISMLDVLLPRSLAGSGGKRKPLQNSNRLPGLSASAVADAEIKRDSRGRLVMVRHRGSGVFGGSGSMTGSEIITFDDIRRSVEKMKEGEKDDKKSENGSKKSAKPSVKGGTEDKKSESGSKKSAKSSVKGVSDDKKSENSSKKSATPSVKGEANDKKSENGSKKSANPSVEGEASTKPESESNGSFTAAEDAKLRELKTSTGKPFKPWREIAKEMGRDLEHLKGRWKQLQAADKDGGAADNTADNKAADAKADDKKDDSSKGEKRGGKGGQQTMDRFVFTEEHDKELRELMAAGANWKTIAKTIHKPQDACRKRWEEIGGDAASKDESQKQEPNQKEPQQDAASTGQSDKKEDTSIAKSDTKKGEYNKPASIKVPSKAGSVSGSVRSTRSSVKFSIREWRTLQEDEFFTFEELQLLCQLIGKDGGRSWLRIASAFHDKTGRRVHPEDIKEKFEAL